MRSVLHQYKLRLTNLSQGNRALRLMRLSARRDVDLADPSWSFEMPAADILRRALAGRSAVLLRNLSARDEKSNLLDRRLNHVYREVRTIFEETGGYPLFIGYPWVEGRFLDGNTARCPVALFPVRLVRDYSRSPRWTIEVPEGEEIILNRTFFLAYEKFHQSRLDSEFWEESPERHKELQPFLNELYQFFKEHEIQVNFNSDLFKFNLERIPETNDALMERIPVGQLKFHPWAVMGVFPQSDSALLHDYEELETKFPHDSLEAAWPLSGHFSGPIPEDKRFFVAPVDQSQEEAILKAKSGRSVVVHGPPGTGKSQVIVNLIADAMAQGKRVLLCSQKRAALDVVYHRLRTQGLHEFSGLLHDFRSDRKRIFTHLRQLIEQIDRFKEERRDLTQARDDHEFRRLSRKIDELSRKFGNLHEALSDDSAFGISAHELYLSCTFNEDLLPLAASSGELDREALEAFLRKLSDILLYLDVLRADHPWLQRRSFAGFGLHDRKALSDFLDEVRQKLEGLITMRISLGERGVSVLEEGLEKERAESFTELASRLENGEDARRFVEVWKEFQAGRADSLEKANAFFESFFIETMNLRLIHPATDDFDILLADLTSYDRHSKRFFRFLSGEYRAATRRLKVFFESRKIEFEPGIGLLRKELPIRDKFRRGMKEYAGLEPTTELPDRPDPESLKSWLAGLGYALDTCKRFLAINYWRALLPDPAKGAPEIRDWSRAKEAIRDLQDFRKTINGYRGSWGHRLHPAQMGRLLDDPAESTLAVLAEMRIVLDQDYDDLVGLDRVLELLDDKERRLLVALNPAIQELQPEGVSGFLDKVRNDMYRCYLDRLEARHNVLAEVSGRTLDKHRDELADTVDARNARVRELIIRRLKDEILDNIEYNRLGNPVTYRELLHQVSKKRRLWTVRRLITEFWDKGLARLIPCWMASPEAVAAVFPMQHDLFDLVIFDEASQCYVERALPVLLRGRTCVVAGDAKQLPPLDLYRVRAEESEEAISEDAMPLEVESALDLAKNLFDSCRLSWHYRSREEALINFSNHAFYEGRLNVPPPARRDEAFWPPIEWVEAPGMWENNRNAAEAQRVVGLLERILESADAPSVGIVTFNYHQQEAIRDAIDKRLQELTAGRSGETASRLYAAFDPVGEPDEEGLFIKNIENVQGDERDIIIFSVGYGRDKRGRLVTRFGLLNMEGGENRLNVAVTRARRKIYVVCSFDPEELIVESATHDGPRLFKRYLQYAKAVSKGDRESALALIGAVDAQVGRSMAHSQRPNPLAREVGKALETAGIPADYALGDTAYQVDLALRDQQGGPDYVLALECEGPQYFSGRSVKEREVYRRRLLEASGWTTARIWARNWRSDPEGEIAKIRAILDRRQGPAQ